MARKYTWLAAIVTLLIWGSNAISLSAQCAMCRTAAESESKTLGLNSGILYLMAVPYLVLGSGLLIWYLRRKQRAEE